MDPTDIPILHGATPVTAQLLPKIGVNGQVQAMDWSTLTSPRAEKKPPGEGGCMEKAWFGWPCGARLEELRDRRALSTDPAEQKRIAVELQRVAYDVVPYVNYGQWFLPTAYRKNLQGVIVSPVPFFWNIRRN